MSRRSHGIPSRERPDRTIDRKQAAALLRSARAGGLDAHSDSADWALSALPGNRHARRLAIQRLLHVGNIDAADALITQGLLSQPTDPLLTRLRAESLFMQGETLLAEKEIGLALERRAHHCATLLLAARIASARGDHPRAVSLLQRAMAAKPKRNDIKPLLVQVLLDAGNPQRAGRMLQTMKRPAPTLRARVLAAQGRLLEAIDLLESARRAGAGGPDSAELLCELIGLLERVGNMARLRRLLEELGERSDLDRAVLLRIGIAWLTLGAFTTASRLMAAISHTGPRQRDALAVLIVAAAMADRRRLGERALDRLQQTAAGADPVMMADLWRRALTARLFSDQYDPRKAGSDRNASLLQPLLRSALKVFDAERAAGGSSRSEVKPQFNRHRAICLAAMGRTREAAAVRGGSPEPAEMAPPAPVDEAPPTRKAA